MFSESAANNIQLYLPYIGSRKKLNEYVEEQDKHITQSQHSQHIRKDAGLHQTDIYTNCFSGRSRGCPGCPDTRPFA